MLVWWVGLALAQTVVELPTGHTLASLRVRGMGGVCTALAESATCQLRAPATVGIRRPQDDNGWGADTTIQLMAHPVYGLLFPSEPDPPPALRVKGQVGANLSMDRWAVGLHARQDGFSGPDGDYLATQLAVPVGLTGGTWSVGASPVALVWDAPGAGAVGWGAVASGLWLPEGTGWRLGASVRTPIRTPEVGVVDWSATRLPGNATLGIAHAFGLPNVAHGTWPDRIPSHEDRSYLLVVGELEVIGGPGDAVDLEGREGEGPSLRGRVGAEADVWKERLRLRTGAYHEPARFGQPLVPHVTAGVGVYLFTWLQGLRWRVATSVDWAPGAPALGVGLETW